MTLIHTSYFQIDKYVDLYLDHLGGTSRTVRQWQLNTCFTFFKHVYYRQQNILPTVDHSLSYFKINLKYSLQGGSTLSCTHNVTDTIALNVNNTSNDMKYFR